MSNPLVIGHLALRAFVGWLGIALVPVLFALAGLKPSISAYHSTEARDVFVGVLWAIGAALLFYRGYDRRDRTAGIVAGLAIIGVALFPHTGSTAQVHAGCAAVFFLSTAYFTLALFTLSAGAMTSRKKARNRVYVACGVVILACVGHVAASALLGLPLLGGSLLWPESIAVLAFGIAWLTKAESWLADLGPGES